MKKSVFTLLAASIMATSSQSHALRVHVDTARIAVGLCSTLAGATCCALGYALKDFCVYPGSSSKGLGYCLGGVGVLAMVAGLYQVCTADVRVILPTHVHLEQAIINTSEQEQPNTVNCSDDNAITQKERDEYITQIMTLLRNDIALLHNVRYAVYGTQDIGTPLDRIIGDAAALCNVLQQLLAHYSYWDETTQAWIEYIAQSKKTVTTHDIAKIFAEHNETLRGYRDRESRTEIREALDKVIDDFGVFEIFAAL